MEFESEACRYLLSCFEQQLKNFRFDKIFTFTAYFIELLSEGDLTPLTSVSGAIDSSLETKRILIVDTQEVKRCVEVKCVE